MSSSLPTSEDIAKQPENAELVENGNKPSAASPAVPQVSADPADEDMGYGTWLPSYFSLRGATPQQRTIFMALAVFKCLQRNENGLHWFEQIYYLFFN